MKFPEILWPKLAKFCLGGGGRRQTYPPPYKHEISLSNLAVLLTLRLLSSSIDRFYPHWSMSKVEKTVERAIHARSTREANFDKYKKHSLRGATGIEKSGWRELYLKDGRHVW